MTLHSIGFVKIKTRNMRKHHFYNVISRLCIGLLLAFGASQAALAERTARSESLTLDETVVVPSGGERALTSRDFGPHAATGSAFNEIWTYTFQFDGGMQSTFSMSYARLGSLMSPVSGAEFSISGFDGKTYRAPKQYDAADLVYTAQSGTLRIHPEIYVTGALPRSHNIRFGAKKDDVRYDVELTLSDIAEGLTWGDGVFEMGKERLGMFIHIPYARVRGTVTIGGVTKQVSGTAYMDHTYQTEFAPKLIQNSYRYVQHAGDMEVGYFITPHDRYDDRLVGFGAVKKGGRFRLRKPESMRIVSARRALGAEIPKQLLLRYDQGDQTILNRERDSQSFSALDDLSGLQRTVVKSYIGGEVAVFRGRGYTNQRRSFVYDFLVVK